MFAEAEHFVLPPLDRDFTGDTLGRYQLDRRLGYGGVASIYAATCKNTGAIFALKVLHPDHDGNPIAVQRFRQEAQLGAQIRHPNLIPVFDNGWLGGHHFIAMELVEGKTLTEVLAQGPIGWERSTAIVCDLLEALATLHERAVAHRDISPNNCMLEDVGGRERARLFDLSHARVVEDMPEADGLVLGLRPESVPMLIYGTPHFIAPERLRGSPGDFRADIFSIGALWYTALTGEALPDPRGADPVSVAQRLDLPPALHAVLLGALEIHVRRHHSAASMLGAIRKALEVLDDRRQREWRRRVQLKSSVLLLSLLAFPVWLMLRTIPTEPTCPATEEVEAVRVSQGELSTNTSSGVPASPAAAANTAPGVSGSPAANPESVGLVSPPPVSTPPVLAEPAAAASDVKSLEEPAPRPAKAAPARRASARVRPPPTSRSDLHRALMKCKPHSSVRFEVAINPGKGVEIDGDRPTGEFGRCVEEAVAAHSPKKAETITL